MVTISREAAAYRKYWRGPSPARLRAISAPVSAHSQRQNTSGTFRKAAHRSAWRRRTATLVAESVLSSNGYATCRARYVAEFGAVRKILTRAQERMVGRPRNSLPHQGRDDGTVRALRNHVVVSFVGRLNHSSDSFSERMKVIGRPGSQGADNRSLKPYSMDVRSDIGDTCPGVARQFCARHGRGQCNRFFGGSSRGSRRRRTTSVSDSSPGEPDVSDDIVGAPYQQEACRPRRWKDPDEINPTSHRAGRRVGDPRRARGLRGTRRYGSSFTFVALCRDRTPPADYARQPAGTEGRRRTRIRNLTRRRGCQL